MVAFRGPSHVTSIDPRLFAVAFGGIVNVRHWQLDQRLFLPISSQSVTVGDGSPLEHFIIVAFKERLSLRMLLPRS